MGEGIEKWEDRRYLVFFYMCVHWEDGKVEKWKTVEKKITIMSLLKKKVTHFFIKKNCVRTLKFFFFFFKEHKSKDPK